MEDLKQTSPLSDEEIENIIKGARDRGITEKCDLMAYLINKTKGQENPQRIWELLKG